MTTNTTRRALIQAAPLTAAALAIPTLAAASPNADDTAWRAALDHVEALEAHDKAFSAFYSDLRARYSADRDRIPHVVLRPDPYTGRREPVTTADDFFVNRARKDVQALDEGRMRFDPTPELIEHEALLRDLVAAADDRDGQIAAIRAKHGMDQADDASDKLGDDMAAAYFAAVDTPAPHLAALRWKLEYLLADDSTDSVPAWSMDYVRQTLADIAALLPQEA